MILSAAMCDTVDEVSTIMLRDKKIAIFDDNYDDAGSRLKLEELCNVECIFASHNLIKEVIGIGTLTTLVELNLSFNMIEDISSLEELTLLRSLFLNHNKIVVIDPIRKLKGLKQLGLFHNEIMESPEVTDILESLPKLRELSIEGNPCAREIEFTYELILRMPKLRMLNEEAIKELDRDVAEQYYVMNDWEVPKPPTVFKVVPPSDSPVKGEDPLGDKENQPEGKSVRFKVPADIDDDEEWQHEKEIKALKKQIEDLENDKLILGLQLTKSHQDKIYSENEMLKLQLKSMDAMVDENYDLKEELERLRGMTDDDRMKEIAEENKALKTRTGELLIELTEVKDEMKKLKASTHHIPKEGVM